MIIIPLFLPVIIKINIKWAALGLTDKTWKQQTNASQHKDQKEQQTKDANNKHTHLTTKTQTTFSASFLILCIIIREC